MKIDALLKVVLVVGIISVVIFHIYYLGFFPSPVQRGGLKVRVIEDVQQPYDVPKRLPATTDSPDKAISHNITNQTADGPASFIDKEDIQVETTLHNRDVPFDHLGDPPDTWHK